MGRIKVDEIRGYHLDDGQIFCVDCQEDDSDFTEDQFITAEQLEGEDEIYFCDKCKKRL